MDSQKVVLITGVTGAVGQVVCRRMADTDYRLALTSRSRESLDSLAVKLGLGEKRILVKEADMTDAAEVQALVDVVASKWGGVDILVNIAGGWKGGKPLGEVTEHEWRSTLEMNLYTAFLVNRAVLPYMAGRKWGRIINFASKAAVSAGSRQAAYNVSKAGIVSLTASIAAEYGRKGISANALLPSIIDTPTNRKQIPDADHSRWVTPDELAALILFLCSEEGGGFNGASIPVYGKV